MNEGVRTFIGDRERRSEKLRNTEMRKGRGVQKEKTAEEKE